MMVLLALYAALYTVVWRAERILKRQYAEREAVEVALSAARENLEQRVRERTAELESVNTALGAEVEERRVAEERAQHLARHDQLTGLANRAQFMERLQEAIARAGRSGREVGVLFLDLDRFKNINDSLGHATGDELLKHIGGLCARSLREVDTVARLGGDEFIICLGDLGSAEEAGVVARRLLADFTQGFDIGGHALHVDASIGISLYPADGADAHTLIRNADTAMYHAKDDGRGTFHFFRPQMTERVKRRLALEMGLRSALERGEFELHYQPVVQVATGRLLGAEALVRWRHPERGLVSPAEFIPVAEDIGLIVPLGAWVLREACMQAARWSRLTGRAPFVAVNLSARQFREGSLVPHGARRARARRPAGRAARTRDHRVDPHAAERFERAHPARTRRTRHQARHRRLRHRVIRASATSSASRSPRSRSTAPSCATSAPTATTAPSSPPSWRCPGASASPSPPKASSGPSRARCCANSAATRCRAISTASRSMPSNSRSSSPSLRWAR